MSKFDAMRAEYDLLEAGLPLLEGMPELRAEAEQRMEQLAYEITKERV